MMLVVVAIPTLLFGVLLFLLMRAFLRSRQQLVPASATPSTATSWIRMAIKDTLQVLIVVEFFLVIMAFSSTTGSESFIEKYAFFAGAAHLFGIVPIGIGAVFCMMIVIRFLRRNK